MPDLYSSSWIYIQQKQIVCKDIQFKYGSSGISIQYPDIKSGHRVVIYPFNAEIGMYIAGSSNW